jgi:hypothetical protein
MAFEVVESERCWAQQIYIQESFESFRFFSVDLLNVPRHLTRMSLSS